MGGSARGGGVAGYHRSIFEMNSRLSPRASKFLKSHSYRLPGSPDRADIIGLAFPCVFKAVEGGAGMY